MVSRVLSFVGIFAVVATPTLAAEMLAFKLDSRYKGAALQIDSLTESKDGRLLITTVAGDLYTAAAADVDWEKSKTLTTAMQEKMVAMESEERAREESRRQEMRLRDNANRHLSVLEASRRYGVSKPAFSVSEGSAFHQAEALPSEDAKSSGTEPGGSSPRTGSSELERLKGRVDAGKAEVASITKRIGELEADRNPDPVSASLRRSELQRRQGELTAARARVTQLESELLAAVSEAAEAAAAKSASTKSGSAGQ